MKSRRKGKSRWSDHYTARAKKEGFPARSVFKLEELQKRWNILAPGQKVLDLGCSPGSWLLYAANVVTAKGQVVGLDIKPVDIQKKANIRIVLGDIFEIDEALAKDIGTGFDVVLSDMAPNTSGIKTVDALRSSALCDAALALAGKVLLPGGAFVCKIFQGEGFDAFVADVKKEFTKYKIFKPESSRKASREIYVIGWDKKIDV